VAIAALGARGGGAALITRGAITRIADRDGVSAPVVERDYVLTHVIESLARSGPPPGLVFKGGTALRLCFYKDFRYSADLDFSLEGVGRSDALVGLRKAVDLCAGSIELPQLGLTSDDALEINYVGPLGRPRSVKLDVAEDELVLETTERPVIRRYTDQPDEPALLRTYALEEVAGEKIRCVIQRQLCRDVSDLHRLFVQEAVDVEDAWTIFERKARFKNLDPARFAERLASRESQYRQHWQNELADLEPDLRPFDESIRQLRRALREHL
jgi:predicted nucleotidyltransferase component of viral defense system